MNKWVVYKHTSPSNKVYVGITSNLKDRWISKGRNYCTYKSIFKNAIEKYGWDNIRHEVLLENISKEEAIYAEKYLIKWYKSHNISYNVTDGGDGSWGRKDSQDTIEKRRNALKGRHLSDEHKKNLSKSHHTEKSIAASKKGLEKAHKVWKGQHHSEETKRRMSMHSDGKGLDKARVASRLWYESKSIPIIVMKDGVVMGEYPLKADVAKVLKSTDSNVGRALKMGLKVKGYTLSYKKGENVCS